MKRRIALLAVLVMALGGVIVAPAATAGSAQVSNRLLPVLATSGHTTCAVRESYRVYCWGANDQGQLGRGSTSFLTTVRVVQSGALLDAIAVWGSGTIDTNGSAFCALKIDRTLACWGDSSNNAIGNGTGLDLTMPTPVPDLANVATASMGLDSTCVVKQDGTVWCMGKASAIVGSTAALVPTKIAGLSSVLAVEVGSDVACALKADKTVWCWGANNYGQLGDGTTTARSGPVKVTGLSDAVALAGGGNHMCAVKATRTVVCWGSAGGGVLGHVPFPVANFSATPLSVNGLSGVTSIGSGVMTTCATTATLVKCWGFGQLGQLGDTQTEPQAAPVRATVSLKNPTGVAPGYNHVCEVADEGRIWCWGVSYAGELGTGSSGGSFVEAGGPGDAFGYALEPTSVKITNSAPGKPTGSSTGARKIKVSWTAPSTTNGTSAPKDYVVYYQIKGSSTWKKFTDSVSTSRTTTVTGLSSGKYYRFKVVPVNWAGAGTTSAVSSYVKAR